MRNFSTGRWMVLAIHCSLAALNPVSLRMKAVKYVPGHVPRTVARVRCATLYCGDTRVGMGFCTEPVVPYIIAIPPDSPMEGVAGHLDIKPGPGQPTTSHFASRSTRFHFSNGIQGTSDSFLVSSLVQ
ncbi:hypothetical protein KQX54_003139 [Cotesia glomerata]|uniref:Secreted protein n=1 Tax=Cotesia glomerata TaxID=32391 RepID=A0AAV7I4A8_COTGL|nr:hypothetical protein KQX54_003139 [Cotesia glomerata]